VGRGGADRGLAAAPARRSAAPVRRAPFPATEMAPCSLASVRRWREFRRRPSLLTGVDSVDLGRLLHVYGLFSRSSRAMDMPGDIWESLMAEVAGGRQICGDGGKLAHDVVAPHARAGWQTKTIEWPTGRAEPIVLGLVSPGDLAHPPTDDGDLAAQILEIYGQRFEHSRRRLDIEDSRLGLLVRLPQQELMHYFEEPFYPAEINAAELQWRRRPSSLAGYRGDRLVFEWYFARGQLRYHPQLPDRTLVIPVPEPLPTDAYLAAGALGEALHKGRERAAVVDDGQIARLAARLRAGELDQLLAAWPARKV